MPSDSLSGFAHGSFAVGVTGVKPAARSGFARSPFARIIRHIIRALPDSGKDSAGTDAFAHIVRALPDSGKDSAGTVAFAHIIRALLTFMAAAVFACMSPAAVSAQIASEDSLYDSTWNCLFEDSLVNNGVIQSICATPDYLITIENTSDDPSQPDTVSAYYKNPTNRDGNPVTQYSLAMRNADQDWEHGNGMAYNEKTNEIYVALYSNDAGGNEGSLYVMDPDTLSFKRKIHIADGYNILGIDYDPSNDQYYTLTDSQAGYSLQRRDAGFSLIEDFGPIDPSPGTNFQDICLCGDYIFLSPLTYGMGIGDFMNIYSLSRRETLLSINMDMGLEAQSVEAEGVCMAHKGVFVCPVTVTREDGSRYVYFFETTLPWFYTIETSARGMTYDGDFTVYTVDDGSGNISVHNMDGSEYKEEDRTGDRPVIGGTVSTGTQQALSGTSFTVTFKPDDGWKVAAVWLDVTLLETEEGAESVTLDSIDGNHRITVDFVPISPPAAPTSTPAPVKISGKASDGENASGGQPGTGNTSGEQPGSQNTSGEYHGTLNTSPEQSSTNKKTGDPMKTSVGKRAFAVCVRLLIILTACLVLITIYYYMYVLPTREKKRRKRRR